MVAASRPLRPCSAPASDPRRLPFQALGRRVGEMEGQTDVQVEAGITLTLGGARSGKSEVAERLASVDGARVTYVATGTFSDAAELGAPVDEAWLARVAAHRARRPADWDTIEVPQGGDLARAVEAIAGLALVDSLGAWVAGLPGFGNRLPVRCCWTSS